MSRGVILQHRAHRKQDVAVVMWNIQRVVWSAEATFREMTDSTIIKKSSLLFVNAWRMQQHYFSCDGMFINWCQYGTNASVLSRGKLKIGSSM